MSSLQAKLAKMMEFEAKQDSMRRAKEETKDEEMTLEELEKEIITWGKHRGKTFEEGAEDLKWAAWMAAREATFTERIHRRFFAYLNLKTNKMLHEMTQDPPEAARAQPQRTAMKSKAQPKVKAQGSEEMPVQGQENDWTQIPMPPDSDVVQHLHALEYQVNLLQQENRLQASVLQETVAQVQVLSAQMPFVMNQHIKEEPEP